MIEGKTLTIDDPNWIKFYNLLSVKVAIEGCNNTLTKTRAVIDDYFEPEYDLGKIIQYLEDHGSYCDCEVLMNMV